MKFSFLGGAMEIGGSAVYVRLGDKGILLDSGIRQGAGADPLPDFATIQDQGGLDAIIISHAHMDHIGSLPIISKAYPMAPIYMTAMTADLTRVLLFDSLKIMDRREDEIPYYAEKDVLSMLDRVVTRGFNSPIHLFEDTVLTFYPAGHIAGAACVYLTAEEGSLFYSGDFSSFSQRSIEGMRVPGLRPDVAVVEATYGSRLHANRQAEENRLVSLVRECAAEGFKILIPAFALGRAQEVQLILRSAIQNGELPRLPVYVDGMVRDINTMYVRNPSYLKNSLGRRVLRGNEPFYTDELQPVARTQDRDGLLGQEGPAVFISSSGMLTGGPSVLYAKRIAASEKGCIIITGYQDEESPGRQLLKLIEQPEEGKLTLDNTVVPVKCRLEQVGLSAHGDKSEIMALLDHLSCRRVFLVHGDKSVIRELGGELAGDYKRNIHLPVCGESMEISLKKKRKQLSMAPPARMGIGRPFTKADQKELWEFWQANYPAKALPVSRIAWIWHGRPVEDEDTLQELQDVLRDSAYFSPNARRLYLYEANTEDVVKAALAPKEMTMQEAEQKIKELFGGFPYRKISYHPQSRQASLVFDFPDAQDREAFARQAAVFGDETGWGIGISPPMNHHASEMLLRSLFGRRLEKTSYYEEEKQYFLGLSALDAQDDELAKKFCLATGWGLEIKGAPSNPGSGEERKNTDAFFCPEGFVEPLEQNKALYCVSQSFEGRDIFPYRKSIRMDGEGRYLELGFLSPMAGYRCREFLQAIASEIGWRIRIGDSVNQIEILRLAREACDRHGVLLDKPPSYLPDKMAVRLKPGQGNPKEALEAVREELGRLTGCDVRLE